MKQRAPIRVVLVDDHDLVRQGVRLILEQDSDVQIVGEASSGAEAVELAGRLRPTVVVMDIGLPDMTGLQATRAIKQASPEVRVLGLTQYADREYALGMLRAGADGYLLKQSTPVEFRNAVRAVARGDCVLHPSVARAVVATVSKPAHGSHPQDLLTEREREILALIAAGYTSKKIAAQLALSPKTIDNHRSRIIEKLQVNNCAEAVTYALQHGLIPARAPQCDAGRAEGPTSPPR